MKINLLKVKISDFISSIKIPLIVFLGYSVFHNFFESIFTKIWVVPFLSKITSSYYLDFLLLIGVSFIIIRFINKLKINYYIDNKHYITNIFLLLTYIYYRCFDQTWTFLPIESFEQIAYLDGVIILLVLNFLQRFFYKDKSPVEDSLGYFFDNSLGKKGEDLLNREKIAIQIAQKVENTFSPYSSFSIGIVSEWGAGKTSFIDLIKRNLTESVIKVDFNPWLSSSTTSISNDFFNTLNESLKKFDSSLSKELRQYSDMVTSSHNSSLNEVIIKVIDSIEPDQSLKDDFEAINSAIKKIGRKVVVFVDDLDRLNNKEIFEIIRIIRNTANFSNFVFIAAYDRDYLINAIKKINSHNAEFFLEKIFQLEIQLPKFEEERVKDKIIELIGPSLFEEDKAHLNNLLYPKGATYIPFINKNLLLATLRDVTRFVNSFLIVYELLKGEVYFSDLFRMELLRLKFPGVYNLVFLSKSEYLESESYKGSSVFLVLKHKQENNKKTEELELIALLRSKESPFNLTAEQIDTIKSILNGIFPDLDNSLFNPSHLNEKAATIPENFERYSHYHLMDSDLSEIEFSNSRRKPYAEFKTQIDKWLVEGLGARLRSRFKIIDSYSDKKDFEKINQSNFYLYRSRLGKAPISYSTDDIDNLLNRIIINKEVNKELYYNSDSRKYNRFIWTLFKDASPPYKFDIELVYRLQSEGAYSEVIFLTKKGLNKTRLEYFKAFLDELSKFNQDIWYMYSLCNLIEKRDFGTGPKLKPNPDAKEALIKFIKESEIDGFIQDIVVNHPTNENLYAIKDIAIEVFGDYDGLVNSLRETNNKDSKYLEEFKVFIDALEKTNINGYTKFHFKVTPVSKNI